MLRFMFLNDIKWYSGSAEAHNTMYDNGAGKMSFAVFREKSNFRTASFCLMCTFVGLNNLFEEKKEEQNC